MNVNSEQKAEFFDVVIPAHIKDLKALKYAIQSVKKNVVGWRRIIVVSKQRLSEEAEWFDEAQFPFSYDLVKELMNGQNVGWNYQQLLKFYASLVIPNIAENVLILDADTVFYRQVKFLVEGLPLYNLAKDKNLKSDIFYNESLNHVARILPSMPEMLPEIFIHKNPDLFAERLKFLTPNDRRNAAGLMSGICRHMIFQKSVLKALFAKIVEIDGSGDEFFRIFLKTTSQSFGVSEYNLYFYFLVAHYSGQYQIRILNYKNTGKFYPFLEKIRKKYHYCSYHSHLQNRSFLRLRKFFYKNFFYENWEIGIVDQPISEIVQSGKIAGSVAWLANKPLTYRADPFYFTISNKDYLIFEEYCWLAKRGRIKIGQLVNNQLIDERVALDDGLHLSYPFTFWHEGRLLMICEAVRARKLVLYEIDQYSLRLNKLREIFSTEGAIDPTLLTHAGKFWLFYCSSPNSENHLKISYSASPFAEFVQHPLNPVKIDINGSRAAGAFISCEGKIYRPGQNCQKSYGGSISFYQLENLTETEFAEEWSGELLPFSKNHRFGLHHIVQYKNFTIIDSKKMIFAPYKTLVYCLIFGIRVLKKMAS